MKILIVTPDVNGIDAIGETRRIQQWHDCAILHGTVTAEDVYRTVQEKAFDVIHFATHGGPDGVLLSSNTLLSAEDIAQFVRLRETQGVFFSACQTGRLASYAVRHGAKWAISSEVDLPDGEAWKLAAAFYSHQRNGHSKDFVGAYVLADSGDGEYALHISPDYVRDLQRTSAAASTMPHVARPITRREALLWGLGLLAASTALAGAVTALAGRF